MANDDGKRKDDREDANLTQQEREFKRDHPETWKQIVEERAREKEARRP